MIHQSDGLSPNNSTPSACPQKIQRAGQYQIMCLHISSDLDTPWDGSDNSFLTDPETDNDTNSVSSTPTLPSKPMPPPIPPVINPYHATALQLGDPP